MTPVELPKVNENMSEATLQAWLVKEGQEIRSGDPLCTLITDKATFDLPAPAAGTVLRVLGPERAMLPVGYVLCVLGTPGEAVPEGYAASNEQLLAAHRGALLAVPGQGAGCGAGVPPGGLGKLRATPAARRLAREAGVALEEVARVLGLKGVIGEQDIQAYLKGR